MKSYLKLLEETMTKGHKRMDRTGTGTYALFGKQLRIDLNEGFPLLTTKRIFFRGVIHELLWMLKGDRNMNIKYLHEAGVHIWDEWADTNGDLGPVYGAQWRNWKNNIVQVIPADIDNKFSHPSLIVETEYIDQLQNVINKIKRTPNDRRLLVTAWNPGELSEMRLPPCHYAYQFFVQDGKLSCMVSMRSVDVFLGLPFDIASYALLTHMVASVCGLHVGELIMSLGDTHLYTNHVDQAYLQLTRDTRTLPRLLLNYKTNINDFQYNDIQLLGYDCHPAIPADISV